MMSKNIYLNMRMPYLKICVYLKLRNFPLSKNLFTKFLTYYAVVLCY